LQGALRLILRLLAGGVLVRLMLPCWRLCILIFAAGSLGFDMDKLKCAQIAANMKLLLDGGCDVTNVGTPGHIDHGKSGQLLIIDESIGMSPELFDELCEIEPQLCQKVLLSSLYGESCRSIEPPDFKTMVKNEHHSNEPWRRKQWRNR